LLFPSPGRVSSEGVGARSTRRASISTRAWWTSSSPTHRPIRHLVHWDLRSRCSAWAVWRARYGPSRVRDYVGIVAARMGDRVSTGSPQRERVVGGILGNHVKPSRPRVGGLALATAGSPTPHALVPSASPCRFSAKRAGAEVGITLNLSSGLPATGTCLRTGRLAAARGRPTDVHGYPLYAGPDPDVMWRLMATGATSAPETWRPSANPRTFFWAGTTCKRAVVRHAPGRLIHYERSASEGEYRTAMGWEVFPQGPHGPPSAPGRPTRPPASCTSPRTAVPTKTRCVRGAGARRKEQAYTG
jgi:beta-glucosidase